MRSLLFVKVGSVDRAQAGVLTSTITESMSTDGKPRMVTLSSIGHEMLAKLPVFSPGVLGQ